MTAAERFVSRLLTGSGDKDSKALSPKDEGAKGFIDEDGNNWAESAIETAIEYLEKEGEEVQRNPFSKGWAIKEGYGKDGKQIQQISSEKGVKDELYEALVADEVLPDGQTLEEHDKRHHPKGYHEGDTCKFRERMMEETEADKGDILDKDKRSGGQGSSRGATKILSKGIVSPEEDQKYLDAVEKGDMKTAQKMVDAVAKRCFGDSAVQDKVWHNTKKKFTEFKNSFPNVFFFAKDKKWADKFGAEERYSGKENTKAYYVEIKKPIDMTEEKSGEEWLSYFKDKGIEVGGNGRAKLERFGDRSIPGYAILNHDSAEPNGTGFRDALVKAGYDGAILEDIKRGSADRTSYGVFDSRGIKSADAVTYDDSGKVIPLSRRFDESADIRGDVNGLVNFVELSEGEEHRQDKSETKEQNGGEQKEWKENTRVYEGLSNKQVKKYKELMDKKHPEMDADLVLTELGKIKDRKVQGDAFAWVMRGAVKLPEDLYKVEQARELATKAKKDPLSYNTPQACINQLMGEGHRVKEKPITVEELKKNPLMSDYRNEGYGVETFQVEDSREGQSLIRHVLNTHWGKDANPWCLLHGDGEGNLSDGSDGGYDAWEYWNHYNALPKRVAFKDGKLLAFMATDDRGNPYWQSEDWDEFEDGRWAAEYEKANREGYDASMRDYMEENHPEVVERYDNQGQEIAEQWWDRKDEPHKGIPIGEVEVPRDPLHRVGEGEIVKGEITVPMSQPLHIGTKGEPGYKKWVDGKLVREITKDGDTISYNGAYNTPIPTSIHRADGTIEGYTDEGNLETLTRYDDKGVSVEYYKIDEVTKKTKRGFPYQYRYVSIYESKNGRENKSGIWYANGNRVQKSNDDGGVTTWYPNGFLMYKDMKGEDGVYYRFSWEPDGELKSIGKREANDEEKDKYRQDSPDTEAFEKPPEMPKGLWEEMQEKIETE